MPVASAYPNVMFISLMVRDFKQNFPNGRDFEYDFPNGLGKLAQKYGYFPNRSGIFVYTPLFYCHADISLMFRVSKEYYPKLRFGHP